MKNQFLLTFILALANLTGQAQDGETRIGVKAGFTSSNIYGADVAQFSNNGSTSALNGFHIGVFVNSKIGRHFWIKSEILTIQKGSVLQIKDKWGQQYRSIFKSQYIDVQPVSPTFHFKGFQLFAGPYISILLNSSIQQKDSLGVTQTNSSIFGLPHQNQEYRQKLDAGFVVGLEYELKCGISFGVNYNQGFVPLFENIAQIVTSPSGPPPPIPKVFNKSLSISLGYSFGGHQKSKAQK